MLNNDLSNRSAPILAFNFERVICQKFKKKLGGYNYEIDQQRVHAINQLYWKEFGIFYVTFEYPSRKLDRLEEELENAGCMFNGTMKVANKSDLLFWFRQQSSGWYYDTNVDLVHAMYPFGQLWEEHIAQIWNT